MKGIMLAKRHGKTLQSVRQGQPEYLLRRYHLRFLRSSCGMACAALYPPPPSPRLPRCWAPARCSATSQSTTTDSTLYCPPAALAAAAGPRSRMAWYSCRQRRATSA